MVYWDDEGEYSIELRAGSSRFTTRKNTGYNKYYMPQLVPSVYIELIENMLRNTYVNFLALSLFLDTAYTSKVILAHWVQCVNGLAKSGQLAT